MTARLRHPSIVMLIAAVLDPRHLCVCLEFGTHGTVGDAVRNRDARIGRKTALRFAASLARTFGDAHDALGTVRAAPLVRPHWWGQVRYRRCAIYFAVLLVGGAFLARALWVHVRAVRLERAS